ncbi:MAG: hypothetical protein PHF84_03220, partial [bacterium]|nr:hypothetical protein [bacterium]
LTQHFLGADVNYKFLGSFAPYGIYRVIFTDDRLSPGNNNFLHILEIGISRTGPLFFKAGCNYTWQKFNDEENKFRNWNTFRIFSEVRSYF